MLSKINIQMWHRLIQMLLIFLKGYLVSKFKTTIIIRSLLNSIICKMYNFIEIIQIKFTSWSPQIAIIINISFETAIDRCYQSEAANIKFPIFIQSRSINVSLHYKCSRVAASCIQLCFDVSEFCLDWYADTSICVFTRLNDPDIAPFLPFYLFQFLIDFIQLSLKPV